MGQVGARGRSGAAIDASIGHAEAATASILPRQPPQMRQSGPLRGKEERRAHMTYNTHVAAGWCSCRFDPAVSLPAAGHRRAGCAGVEALPLAGGSDALRRHAEDPEEGPGWRRQSRRADRSVQRRLGLEELADLRASRRLRTHRLLPKQRDQLQLVRWRPGARPPQAAKPRQSAAAGAEAVWPALRSKEPSPRRDVAAHRQNEGPRHANERPLAQRPARGPGIGHHVARAGGPTRRRRRLPGRRQQRQELARLLHGRLAALAAQRPEAPLSAQAGLAPQALRDLPPPARPGDLPARTQTPRLAAQRRGDDRKRDEARPLGDDSEAPSAPRQDPPRHPAPRAFRREGDPRHPARALAENADALT